MNKIDALIYGNLVTIAFIICCSLTMLYLNLLSFENTLILVCSACVTILIASMITIMGMKKQGKKLEEVKEDE